MKGHPPGKPLAYEFSRKELNNYKSLGLARATVPHGKGDDRKSSLAGVSKHSLDLRVLKPAPVGAWIIQHRGATPEVMVTSGKTTKIEEINDKRKKVVFQPGRRAVSLEIEVSVPSNGAGYGHVKFIPHYE